MFPVPNGHTEDHVSSFCPSCACTSRSHLASRHSEVPEGDLMDVAAPGEGEAVPLQKLIGFGMVGGYSIFGMDADHVQAQAYHFVDLG